MIYLSTRDNGTDVSASGISAAPTSSDSSGPSDKTSSITIVLSIIGAILTLASVIVAVLQYRSQEQRVRDVERDGHEIEMNPEHPIVEEEASPTASPA